MTLDPAGLEAAAKALSRDEGIALWDEWTPAAQSDLLTAAEAAVRAYLAAAVPTDGKTLSREFDEDGRALCFQCGEPQSAHPDGEECEGREYARGFAAGRAAGNARIVAALRTKGTHAADVLADQIEKEAP